MVTTVELNNAGPVEHLEFKVPREGGVVELRGRNGTGKSIALDAIATAMNGKGKVPVRDGATVATVEAFGISLRIGRRITRTGELEVESIDSGFSVDELVDPGLKSPEAADAKRIKALVQLSNVKADASMFHRLIGSREEFESLVRPETINETEDLVLMAERIKRDLDKAALAEERAAENADGRAKGAEASAAGVDADVETDAKVLDAALESAIRKQSELVSRFRSAQESRAAYQRAEDSLEDADADYDGPTLEGATKSEDIARLLCQARGATVAKLEKELAEARVALDQANASHAAARASLRQVQEREHLIAVYRETIARGMIEGPTQAVLDQAAAAVQDARAAVERGTLARRAAIERETAKQARFAAESHRRKAIALRDAAQGTDDVLSEVVAKTSQTLEVEAGRLVLGTKRGKTFFHDLSMGERWRIAIDAVAEALGEDGVCKLRQEAWEALDPINRTHVVQMARGKRIVFLTARATADDQIVAQVL